MLLGGKWGNGWHCPICNSSNSGARLKCLNCEYKTLEDLDTCKECGAKREWVELTEDEIMDLVRDECVDMRWPSTPLFIARAVIAADRKKNK